MDDRALSPEEIEGHLAELPGWTLVDGRLHREYAFTDFSEAFGFMTRAALAAERLGHHPDWSNSFSRVTVDLTTHDAEGVTELDVELAREMETLSSGNGSS